MSKNLNGHDKKVTSKPHDQRPKYNCTECPIEENCQDTDVDH